MENDFIHYQSHCNKLHVERDHRSLTDNYLCCDKANNSHICDSLHCPYCKVEIKTTTPEKDYSTQKQIYDLVLNGDSENPVYQITYEITAKTVELQDQMILDTIRNIGGTTCEELTFDRGKVLEMLKKHKPVKPLGTDAYPHHLYCPTCYNKTWVLNREILKYTDVQGDICNYCPNCGQKIDWSDYITQKGERK